jgi:hypothetical protein
MELLDKFRENIKLVKIDFVTFSKNYFSNLYFNRKINDEKVNELYEILVMNNYELPWTCHVLMDRTSNKRQIIDGQHRYEAICKYLEVCDKIDMDNKYIYVWEYEVNDMRNKEDNKYALDIYRKLNNNTPLTEEDMPKNKIVELLMLLRGQTIIKNGIGYDDKHKTCHSPKIHEKELFELLNKHEYLIQSMSISEIISNIYKINAILSGKTKEEMYKNKRGMIGIKEQKIYDKAVELLFYLGIKDCMYSPSYWIKYINNPNDL